MQEVYTQREVEQTAGGSRGSYLPQRILSAARPDAMRVVVRAVAVSEMPEP